MIRATLLAIALLWPTACHAAPRSQKAFAADMLRRLRTAMPGKTLASDTADPLAITVDGDGPPKLDQINLHNIYAACEHATKVECRAYKAEFVSATASPMPPITAADLRLVVRNADYVAAAKARFADDPDRQPLTESIGGDLYAMLAADSPTSTTLASQTMLRPLNLSPAAAWALAARQTAAKLPPVPTPAKLKAGGVSIDGFDYTASLLLDRKAWTALAQKVGPDLFVTVVSDGLVLVGVRPDGPALNTFRTAVAEDCAAQAHCISPHIYRFRDGRWAIAQ
jgi:hypothetical protein